MDHRAEGGLRSGRLAPGEEAAAAEVLARAFRDNPLNAAVIRGGPGRRLRSNRYGMRALLPVAVAHGEVWVLHEAGAVRAALVAVPPFQHPLPLPPLGVRVRVLFGQGLGVSLRWAEVFEELDRLHPPAPHWYLGTFGVDPDAQGRGLGRALLLAWLGHVDEAPEDVYLETDRPENLAFYEQAGFAAVRETAVCDVSIWCMRRPARNPG